MKRNNLLETIDSWGPLFKVTFDLMIHSKLSSSWSSILSFKGNGGLTDYVKYGDRAPAIFYNKRGFLHICNALNGNRNYCRNKMVDLNKWYRIEVEQVSMEGKVRSRKFKNTINIVLIFRFTT